MKIKDQEEMWLIATMDDVDEIIETQGVEWFLENLSRLSSVSLIAYLRQTAKDNNVTANKRII